MPGRHRRDGGRPNTITSSAHGTHTVSVQLADVSAARELTVTSAGKTINIARSINRLFEAESGAALPMDNLALVGCTTGGAGQRSTLSARTCRWSTASRGTARSTTAAALPSRAARPGDH